MSDTQTGHGQATDRRRVDVEGNPLQGTEPVQPTVEPRAENAEPPKADAELAAAREELSRAESELTQARKRVDELARAYQAVQQDREEFKQRLTRERERMIDVERGNVARTLLEAIDELDRCLGAAVSDESPLAQGVRLIRNNLLTKLTETGIERLNLLGQTYDPNVAEAVDMEVTPKPEDDQKIVQEIHAGYRLKDRVIRPARVKVAKYVAPAQA